MVKKRLNGSRTYDKEGFVLRAACLCVRDKSEREVLLVSGSNRVDRWIVPGGGIEPCEEAWNAALREVLEEAGVKGRLDRCLGVFETCKTRTCVYVLVVSEVLDVWEESTTQGRQRKWFTLDEARYQLGLYRPAHCIYLDELRASGPASSQQNSDSIAS